jgi:hypothetical protein
MCWPFSPWQQPALRPQALLVPPARALALMKP